MGSVGEALGKGLCGASESVNEPKMLGWNDIISLGWTHESLYFGGGTGSFGGVLYKGNLEKHICRSFAQTHGSFEGIRESFEEAYTGHSEGHTGHSEGHTRDSEGHTCDPEKHTGHLERYAGLTFGWTALPVRGPCTKNLTCAVNNWYLLSY